MSRLAMITSSRRGSTIERILASCQKGMLVVAEVTPSLIIATNSKSGALDLGPKYGMDAKDVLVLRPRDYQLPEFWGLAVIEACLERGIDLIGLYGCMFKVPVNLIEAFPGRMINQHPGPVRPGKIHFGGEGMYGLRVHAAVLEFARNVGRDFSFTEAIAQRVAPKLDEGSILAFEQVEIRRDDTPESLQQRVLSAEYRVQIKNLYNFGIGQVKTIDLPEIVLPDEVELLNEAKRKAIEQYPKG